MNVTYTWFQVDRLNSCEAIVQETDELTAIFAPREIHIDRSQEPNRMTIEVQVDDEEIGVSGDTLESRTAAVKALLPHANKFPARLRATGSPWLQFGEYRRAI